MSIDYCTTGKTINFIGSKDANQGEGSLRSGSTQATLHIISHDHLSTTISASSSSQALSSACIIPPSSSVPVNLMTTGLPISRLLPPGILGVTTPLVMPSLIPPPVDAKKVVEDKRKLLWGDKKADKPSTADQQVIEYWSISQT